MFSSQALCLFKGPTFFLASKLGRLLLASATLACALLFSACAKNSSDSGEPVETQVGTTQKTDSAMSTVEHGDSRQPGFSLEVIDDENMGRRAIADIDHDGFNDIIVHRWADERGKKGNGELAWYRYPDWRKFIIASDKEFFGDYIEAADLDNDGDIDVIAPVGTDGVAKLYAYIQESSSALAQRQWREVFIGEVKTGKSEAKDIMLADFDLDGLQDIAIRSDSAAAILFNNGNLQYQLREIPIRSHEGATLGDLDADGDIDIVLNGYWLANPGDTARSASWQQHDIDPQWFNQETGEWRDNSVRVQVAEINGDNKLDVVYTHSEKDQFSFAWYESVDPVKGPSGWIKHDLPKQNYAHTLLAYDADLDGDVDLFTTGTVWNDYNHKRKARPTLWTNDGAGNFTESVVGDQFNYVGVPGDIDNNGTLDVTGTLAWDRPPIYVLRNNLNYPADQWRAHVIDTQRKKYGDYDKNWEWLRYFGLSAVDAIRSGENLNERHKDLVSGRFYYHNPGSLDGVWERSDLGLNVDAGIVADVDGDNYQDLIAFQGPKLFWLEQTSVSGSKQNLWTHTEINFTGDFQPADHLNPQGARVVDLIPGGRPEISFEGGDGLYVLDLSRAPKQWALHKVASTTGDGHAWGDFDKDGDMDLITAATQKPFAISLFENLGKLDTEFQERRIGELSHDSDRVEVADLNKDGLLDIVVGQEVYPVGSAQTDVYLFTQNADDEQAPSFTRKTILPKAESVNSLRLKDMDFDGDIDIVLGEMGGDKRIVLLQNDGSGDFSSQHMISTGREIHGLILEDLDGDQDTDAAAIAWDNHPNMYVFENLSVDSYAGGKKKALR